VILCRPQRAENIGLAARAMLNCGLTEMRLVSPPDDWRGEKARNASSGADALLEGARLFAKLDEAVADLTHVFAATARPRNIVKPVVTPRAAGASLRALVAEGQRPAFLVGPERFGLTNDEVSLADTIITANLNPAFSSLNLAQAVLLLGYEWLEAANVAPDVTRLGRAEDLASKAELMAFLGRLEGELDACGFLADEGRRPYTVLDLRAFFQRARPTAREVGLLEGVVRFLSGRNKRQ
jgi:tRNA/rRNA methyltransferase